MTKSLSAPLLRTARLLDLVPYLHANQGISIKSLADEFGVSHSQIESDLTTLWMCGLPGYTPLELMDLEFESGFVTIRNATTLAKPRKISFEEGLALLLGLQLLQQRIPLDRQDLNEDIDSLSGRLSLTLGVPKTVRISNDLNPEVIPRLIESMKTSTDIEIVYHSLYSDNISTRRIIPQSMYEESERSYIKAFCYLSNSYRVFRVDRILSCKDLDTPEGRKSEAPTSNVVEDDPSKQSKNGEITYEIEITTVTRDIAERFGIHTILQDKENEAPKVIELVSFSHLWIERAVLASASDVELSKPADIRQDIYDRAKSVLNLYTS
jgi:proteasome accessory factor C